MVPMVFVYAPTMLIVIPEYFTVLSFLHVSLSCALGVFLYCNRGGRIFSGAAKRFMAFYHADCRFIAGGAQLAK